MKKFLGCAAIAFLSVQTLAVAYARGLPTIKTTANGHVLELEVARSESERKSGLSGRDSLPANRGMLFVLPWAMPVDFWMKGMAFPLDIAFLDSEGRIADIQTTKTDESGEHYLSPGPVAYVIEVNRGWFLEHDVKVGDRIDLNQLEKKNSK